MTQPHDVRGASLLTVPSVACLFVVERNDRQITVPNALRSALYRVPEPSDSGRN